MTAFTVERTGDVPLAFEGDLLADRSSRVSGNTRWTEVRIYRTESGKFVTEMVGRSIRKGEVDRRTVVVHDDTDTIRAAIMRPNPDTGQSYMTRTAREALFDAAPHDHRIMAIVTERI